MKSVRYEMLGAPTLLYRHNGGNNSASKTTSTGQKIIHQRFHPEILTPQQIHMRDYLEMDPYRKWFLPDDDGGGKKMKKAQQRKRPRGEISTDFKKATAKKEKSNNSSDTKDVNFMSDESELKDKVDGTDDSKKKRLALKYFTYGLDESDVPEEYIVAKQVKDANSSEERKIKEEFDGAIDDVVCDFVNGISTTDEIIQRNEVGGALGFGNCLVAITCTCRVCCSSASAPVAAKKSNDDSDDSDHDEEESAPVHPTSFLVHPVGERLSSVAIDKLRMPRDQADDEPQENNSHSNVIDVGGTILQIAICGMGVTTEVKQMNQEDDGQSECLIVRTSRYIEVILARACSNENGFDDDANSMKKGDDIDSLSSEKVGGKCSTTFELMKLSRIDLCTSNQPSYLPAYVACDPKVVFSPFASPSFAILSRTNEEKRSGSINCTTIHSVVQFGEESMITKHAFSSLGNISLIEFHVSEMSVLWAAARASNVPKPYKKDNDDSGGTLKGGYGHSLFKINLRDDSVVNVWSPSRAEYRSEGVHSINGIMNDLHHKHVLWVSSSSACKVWALDVRHNNPNVLMCFSLAQLSDDFGPELGVTGIYGAGMMMTQPLPMNEYCGDSGTLKLHQLRKCTPPTIFGLKKDPNTYSLHTYQLPSTMPRFHTKPLEASGFVEAPTVKYSTSSIARSNIYPLPICSDKTFHIGLATLRSSSNSALRQLDWKDTMGYDEAPDVIYVVTMTSVGDLYCHALLECDSTREIQARRIDGNGVPVGTSTIPVPLIDASTRNNEASDGGCLHISLSNDFPALFNDVA